MSHLNSYLPESLFLIDKKEDHMRLCYESCAVLDPADGYRVIACRGKGIEINQPFAPIASLSRSERDFLDASLGRHNRLFLSNGKEAILLCADLLPATGLCLAIVPEGNPKAVYRVLHFLGKDSFVSAPEHAADSLTPHVGDDAVYRRMSELFSCLEGIGARSPELFWTRVRWLSRFAGCRLENMSLPRESVTLAAADDARLTVFLLCLFLSLRRKSTDGDRVELCEGQTLSLSVTVCAKQDSDEYQALSEEELRGLFAFPAFRNFTMQSTQDGYRLLAGFAKTDQVLQLLSPAAVQTVLCLRFHLVS